MVTCIASGLTVAGIDAARTFVPGDEIDPNGVVATREGGQAVTWRDVLGDHLATHFAEQIAPAEPTPRRRRVTEQQQPDAAE